MVQSEGSVGDNTWSATMEFANYMQDALVAGNVSAYIPWALGSNDPDDGHAVTVYSGGNEIYYRLPTYVFKHFSRYNRPGSVRFSVSPDNPAGVTASAYIHDANQTQTVVLINNGSAAEVVNITIPAQPEITTLSAFTSKQGSYWQETSIEVSGATATVEVPPNGIVTLYGAGGGTTTITPEAAPHSRNSIPWAGNNLRYYSIQGKKIRKPECSAAGLFLVTDLERSHRPILEIRGIPGKSHCKR